MQGLCDVHSHFLPDMDDGCSDAAQARELLKSSYAQGITQIFATPHYYPVESVDEFLQRREASLQALKSALSPDDEIPEICLGAEVAYRQGISQADDIEKLCLGNSKYLLLELPYRELDNNTLREICNISVARGIAPVLAHVDRYMRFIPDEVWHLVLQMNALLQINADAVLHRSSRSRALSMLRKGQAHLLGSDCHDLKVRKQNLTAAFDYLCACGMQETAEQVKSLSFEIFSAAKQ